jgi:hypothetical protein
VASASAGEQDRIALNFQQVRELSQQTFRTEVDASNTLRLQGRWPRVCGESAKIHTAHTKFGLRMRIFVSERCFDLLKLKNKRRQRLPTMSIASVGIDDYVSPSEIVYLESATHKLDLELPSDYLLTAAEEADRNWDYASPTDLFQVHKKNTIEGSLKYHRCSPEEYATTDPGYCNNRYGWDINADIPLTSNTTIRGTTQLDIANQEGAFTNITGRAGIRLDILYRFGH